MRQCLTFIKILKVLRHWWSSSLGEQGAVEISGSLAASCFSVFTRKLLFASAFYTVPEMCIMFLSILFLQLATDHSQ